MDIAFRSRRGRWELDGHELASGSIVHVNLGDHWIKARDKCDSNQLKVYYLLLNGGGTVLMSTTLKTRRPGNGART